MSQYKGWIVLLILRSVSNDAECDQLVTDGLIQFVKFERACE